MSNQTLARSISRLKDRCIADASGARFVQWAREYGHGKADDLGYAHVNALQRLHDHAGWLPPPEPVRAPVRTEADRTNKAFEAYQADNWKYAQVLKNRYFRPNDYMPCRLKALKRIGVDISGDTYARWLEIAMNGVMAELRKIV
jgi:hypothetical protein